MKENLEVKLQDGLKKINELKNFRIQYHHNIKPRFPKKPKLKLQKYNPETPIYLDIILTLLACIPLCIILGIALIGLSMLFEIEIIINNILLITISIVSFLAFCYLSFKLIEHYKYLKEVKLKNSKLKKNYEDELKKYHSEVDDYDSKMKIYNDKLEKYRYYDKEIKSLEIEVSKIKEEIAKQNNIHSSNSSYEKSKNELIQKIEESKDKFDWNDLKNILNDISYDDFKFLNKLLKNEDDKTPHEIVIQIKKLAQPKFDNNINFTYKNLLINISEKLNINSHNKSITELEKLIVQRNFKNVINKLTNEQKSELENKLISHYKNNNFKPELVTLASLTGAQLSGFGVYVAASTIVGGITSAIGVTLPFAFYTGMSSVISTIVGPVGWLGLAGYSIYRYNRVNYDHLIPIIIYIIYLKNQPIDFSAKKGLFR